MTIVKSDAKKETLTVAGRIEAFLIKYRKAILVTAAVIVAGGAAAGIGVAATESARKKGLDRVDRISAALVKADGDGYAEASGTALAELESLTTRKNIVGARANMLKAEILFNDKKFDGARDAWLKAADADKKSYIAPLSWFNAAACCEELGDSEAAFEWYRKAGGEKDFTLKTHALFNAGRVKDEVGDYEAAAKAYQELNDAHAGDSWANLAMTRIIALRAEGKIQ
jgi:tetratricopeptide (TPR) repeat protein